MAIGDQTQQVASMGLDQLNNVMLKSKISDKRKRNEMLRLGQQDPTAFAVQNTQALQQPEQPTEFLGAGRKEYQPGTIDESLLSALGGTTQRTNSGQNFYYSGNYDLTKAKWGTQDQDDINLGGGKYTIMEGGQSLGTGYKSLADSIKDLQRQKYSVSPTQQWQAAQPLYKSAGYKWNGESYGDIQVLDQAAMDTAGIRQNPNWRAPYYDSENPFSYSYQQPSTEPQYQKAVDGFTVRNGDFFTSQDAAKQAIEQYAGEHITGNTTRDWETLGQLLNYGSVTGDFSTPHAIGGNKIADPITGLNTLYGSKPIIYDGKLLGYSGDIGVDPIKDEWNNQWQNTSTSGGIFNKKTTTNWGWDIGNLGMGRQLNDPNWLSQNAQINGNKFVISPDKAAQNPGWLNADYFNRDTGGGSQTSKRGFLGGLFSIIDPILDKVDPMHNKVQEWITGSKETEGQMPYFQAIMPMILSAFFPVVGSALAAIDSASVGDGKGAVGNTLGAYLGMSGGINTGYGALANASANSAASGAINSFSKGGDLADMFKAAALGGLGGFAGAGVGQATQGMNPALSGFLSGASKGAVYGLAQPKNMFESALSSGASGGLAGMFTPTNTTPEQKRAISNNANNTVKLAKLFVKRK